MKLMFPQPDWLWEHPYTVTVTATRKGKISPPATLDSLVVIEAVVPETS